MKDSIKIEQLKNIFNIIIKKLEEEYGNEITFSDDYYWYLCEEEVYNVYDEPKSILLGQITFDIENLERLEKEENILLSYDLILVAELLKMIRRESRNKW